MSKKTIPTLLAMKEAGEKVSQVTCYDCSMARLVDAAGIDTILVGDSLGMTMQGYPDTLPVTMEEMITYGRSVVRGAPNTFVIMDMPFMSYQVSVEQAVANAGRLIKETGANAVKLEGGAAVAEQIRAIVASGIPVCAHIGMTPQSANIFGGWKVQGKGEDNARRVLEDAFIVQEAGAFMCVLECVPPKLAALITKKVKMVTIGIGGGAGCDGQVLVIQDMLQMSGDFKPKFVKQFAQIGTAITEALQSYDQEVKAGTFPAPEHGYAKSDCSDEYLSSLDAAY
jgi:3-methyl-2-oxobutanoate hydroxymethyltransferase